MTVLSYLLALYYRSSSGTLSGLDLNDVTQTNFDGNIEIMDKMDYELRVNEGADHDSDAFFALSAGTYYLQVKPVSDNDTPDYEFVVDLQPFIYENDEEPNGSLETASAYKTGSWQEGQIILNGLESDADGQDWYAVNVPEAGSYRFNYASDGFFRGNFTWYDQQGRNIVLNNGSSDATNAATNTVVNMLDAPHKASLGVHADSAAEGETILTFPQAGSYFVCVEAVDAGSYKFCLSPVAASLANEPASTDNTGDSSSTADTSATTADSSSTQSTVPPTGSSPDIELVFLLGQAFYNSNGAVITMDAVPYAYNNRVFLPIRALANGIGIADSGILWNSVDRTVTLTDGATTLSMVLDSPVLYVNGAAQNMDVSPANASNRVFLPARYIAEAYGLTTEWEPVSGSVIIRGQKSSPTQTSVPDSVPGNVSDNQQTVGTIELDRQMIGDELRKGSYNGSLVNGQPSGNGTWVDCLGRIKTGNFTMSGSADITIKNAHVAFPDGAEFTGTYSAVLYTAIEKFAGHFVFPNNGNAFDGVVENTADLQQHMVGKYTLPNGNTVDVDRYYDLSGGN